MSYETSTEKSARIVWDRTGRELPEWNDDAALLALIEKAQANCEVALSGLVLVLGNASRNAAGRYGWAIEHEAQNVNGFGAAMSMLYLAVQAYDTDTHTSRVGNRLAADVQYLASKPAKYGDARRAWALPMTNDRSGFEERYWQIDVPLTVDEDHGIGDTEMVIFIEQVLGAEEVPARCLEVGMASFVRQRTDRQIADELQIPFGSVARIRKMARELLTEQLVA